MDAGKRQPINVKMVNGSVQEIKIHAQQKENK
jgi:hypothetical protein